MFEFVGYSRPAPARDRRPITALSVERLEARDLLAASVASLKTFSIAAIKSDATVNTLHRQIVVAPEKTTGNLRETQMLSAGAEVDQLLRGPATGSGPVIEDFIGVEEGPYLWTLQGTVVGGDVAGLVVEFGGMPSLQDGTAVVQDDGSFHLVVHFQPGECGTATAQTTDSSGSSSNIARTPVCPTDPDQKGPASPKKHDGGPGVVSILAALEYAAKGEGNLLIEASEQTAGAPRPRPVSSSTDSVFANTLSDSYSGKATDRAKGLRDSREGAGQHSTIEREPLLQWSVGLKPPQPLELE